MPRKPILNTVLALGTLGMFTLNHHASAQTLSITNTATNFAPGVTSSTLQLDQFDSNLGALSDVTVRVNLSGISGFFGVQTTFSPAFSVSSFSSITISQSPTNSLGFTQLQQSNITLVTTPPIGFTVPAATTTNIPVATTNVFINETQIIDSLSWGAYQSVTPGKIAFNIAHDPNLFLAGGGFTLQSTNVVAETSMSVIYTYVVPEPSTYALLALAGLSLAAYGWRRRAQH